MQFTSEQILQLSEIIDDLMNIRMEITYPGYLQDKISVEQAIAKIAENLEVALETILSNATIEKDPDHDPDSEIDYTDIYGWGGQDYSPR